MYQKIRQDAILDILHRQGYATVRQLTEELHYSTATINRDLNLLESQKLIKRSYGGAQLLQTSSIPLPFRYDKMKTAKRHIGKLAASFVKDGDTIFIDGTTTTQSMAQYLTERKNLTVITNNMALVSFLSKYDITAICLGGKVVEIPHMLCGPVTIENASIYHADKMFFSTGSMTPDGTIGSSELYHLLHRTMAKNSDQIFYLVDHEKIGPLQHNISLFSAEAVDYVITDAPISPELIEKFPSTQFLTAAP
jgi:DeoR/GlpR family transcriptional regulator of sugar metabolism